VLLPRAELAREALPDGINAAGGVAHVVVAYRTLPAVPDPQSIQALAEGIDIITFTSSSTVRNFVDLVRRAGFDPLHLPGEPLIACIGPITARTALEAGFRPGVVAEQYTVEGLVGSLLRYKNETG
jgi:uroporphyrinogen-III synthase